MEVRIMATKETKESKEMVKVEKGRALSPFDAMERRFADMERMFEGLFRRPLSLFGPSMWPEMKHREISEISPSVDVFEEKDEIVVKAELPGMSKENLSVDFTDGSLIISGEKKEEEKVEKKNYFMVERSFGSFTRTLRMPTEVQADRAKAKF